MDVFAPAFLRMARDIAAHLGRRCKVRENATKPKMQEKESSVNVLLVFCQLKISKKKDADKTCQRLPSFNLYFLSEFHSRLC